jgi:hypothetical protein
VVWVLVFDGPECVQAVGRETSFFVFVIAKPVLRSTSVTSQNLVVKFKPEIGTLTTFASGKHHAADSTTLQPNFSLVYRNAKGPTEPADGRMFADDPAPPSTVVCSPFVRLN